MKNKTADATEMTPHANGMLIEVDETPKSKLHWLALSIQHILAMFVACVTVPMIVFGSYRVMIDGSYVSLSAIMIAPTLVSAGIGTLFYLFVTKGKSPMFLASSFAYMTAMSSALTTGVAETGNINSLWILPIGMLFVGIIYCVVALLIRIFGVGWLNKLLPPIVVGPVIMVIGLSLAGSAINNLCNITDTSDANYSWPCIICGLVAMVVTAVCAHYGKKTVSLIPFMIGMGAGYLCGVIFTAIGYYGCQSAYWRVVNFDPLVNLFTEVKFTSFLDYPKFLFLTANNTQVQVLAEDGVTWISGTMQPLTAANVGQAAIIFIPVSLVTICEHIGDHKNMSGILQRDLLEQPGLTRTLIGDGVATAISGLCCGAANTTYGENVAVVGVTKVASTKVIGTAALLTILLGFVSPLMGIAQTIPACVTGGVSLLLYGFIAASGVKLLYAEHVDMGKTKNIFVASVILVAGIGGLVFNFNDVVEITSVSVAMILGIVMNLILRDKKPEEKKE